jgi:hypothetical protein
LVKKSKKEKPRLPTEEEFLKFIPRRAEFEWKINSEGLVEIIVPKFRSNFGKSFCKIIKKDDTFSARMDKIGSAVWQECDGKKEVKKILDIVRKKFPNENDIDQRLYLFLQQMYSLDYIYLLNKNS